jgi:hypothetical protein
MMRSIARISAYFSIGFVLIFMGKISKAELFQNYHKGIAELNDRNSQDIEFAVSFDSEKISSFSVVPQPSSPQESTTFPIDFISAVAEKEIFRAGSDCDKISIRLLRYSRQSMAP